MTVRVKLALLFGVLFLLAGAALLTISYQLVARNLPAQTVTEVSAKDVALRAAKMAKDPKLMAGDRAALATLANLPPGGNALDALKKGVVQLSPATRQALTAALPINVRNDALHQLLVQSSIALGVMAIVSIALGWFVSGRVLRPLTKITDTARNLSVSNLDQRIDLAGPDDELTRLANTFDGMLDRLAASFEGQRRFVANASHELRTPLTIMATELDVTLARPDATVDELRAMGTTVRNALDRSDRLITSLLALAQVEHGVEIAETTDLAMVAAEAINRREPESRTAHLDVTTSLEPSILVGDRGLLDRLVDNLIENAIRYNVVGGWLHIETCADDTEARLEVASSGATVTSEAAGGLFVPFRRLNGRTGGQRSMGLGLSIVQAIARAHGGNATATPVDGGGLRVNVRFARTEPPAAPMSGDRTPP